MLRAKKMWVRPVRVDPINNGIGDLIGKGGSIFRWRKRKEKMKSKR